jgi:hypothetical protein
MTTRYGGRSIRRGPSTARGIARSTRRIAVDVCSNATCMGDGKRAEMMPPNSRPSASLTSSGFLRTNAEAGGSNHPASGGRERKAGLDHFLPRFRSCRDGTALELRLAGSPMRIAQLAPLAESVPPKLYGGTERVVAWLVDELVALGHQVTLFASGDSQTRGELHPVWPRALRLGRKGTDPNAACAVLLAAVAKRAKEFDMIQACGTPVIAYRSGSVPEVIGDGVTGFIVEDEKQAIAAVHRVEELDRRKIRSRFEERFSARRMAKEYEGLYRKLAVAEAPPAGAGACVLRSRPPICRPA